MGEMEKDRSIIAMGAWLEVLSEEKDGNNWRGTTNTAKFGKNRPDTKTLPTFSLSATPYTTTR
ncbi:hypothetical protein NmNIID838_15250 [Neisseria meningitidis]|nr:hypothetical protein NmNIID838_15250 [Neisseria meningitidis]